MSIVIGRRCWSVNLINFGLSYNNHDGALETEKLRLVHFGPFLFEYFLWESGNRENTREMIELEKDIDNWLD